MPKGYASAARRQTHRQPSDRHHRSPALYHSAEHDSTISAYSPAASPPPSPAVKMPILALCLLLFISSSHASPEEAPLRSLSSPDFLKAIVEEIAAKEFWDLKAGVRISEFDAGSALVGDSQRYEFQIRVRGALLTMRFSEVELWRQLGSVEELDLGTQGGVVGDLVLEGPLDVHVGGGDGELTLRLPAMNMTGRGIQRVVVGAGIQIKVKGAQQVSLSHPFGAQVVLNGDSGTTTTDVEKSKFLPLGQSSCPPLLSVRVVGKASIIARKTHNYKASIGVIYRSRNMVELLPDKCYSMHYRPIRSSLHTSLHSKLVEVERRLGVPVFQEKSTRFLKAKITPPTLARFRMVLERNITANDRIWKIVPSWRTRLVTARQSYDIVARVGGPDLDPSIVKKWRRAYTVEDSKADRMSNMSFALFPPAVSPPEALTLDVKW